MIENYVVIIGAMKAGTTSLFQLLAQHPSIAPCQPKEPGFFAFEEIFDRGFCWYESLFAYEAGRHAFGLEASTDYSKYPYCKSVAERMEQSGRNFKLIYIMRHPLRRIESHARHVQAARKELGQIVSDKPDHSLDAGVSELSLAASRYALQLDQYQSFFERGDLLILSFEEMTSAPENIGRKVLDFLGLEAGGGPLTLEQHNAAKRIHRAGEPHKLWRAAQAFAPLRWLVKLAAPAGLRRSWREKTRPAIQIKGRFKLTAAEEEALLAALTPDLARLQNVYGFDVAGQWGLRVL